jgi:S1-C subfamily serine protease
MYAVLAASGLWANGAAAQKSSGATTERKTETVVIKQDDAHPQTVIQIQNGTVVVNGDTVATAGDRSSKKIIIDRESDAPMARSGGGNMFGIPNAGARKARLGVLTDPALSTGGAYVKEVQPGSPAEAAGLKAGDKITKVDGSTIADSKDLVETISTHDPEDTVRLTYLRGTATRTTTAKLESPQDEGGARSFGFGGPGMDLSDLGRLFGNGGDMFGNKSETATPKLGLTVEDRADGSGVRILDVKPEGAAAKAGLKADDIILELGSNKLASIDELQRTVRTLQGEEVAIRYQRSGKTATAKITIPKVLRKRDM